MLLMAHTPPWLLHTKNALEHAGELTGGTLVLIPV